MRQALLPRLQAIAEELATKFGSIPGERRTHLDAMATFVGTHPEKAELLFVCTHNSRRSHMAQLWAQAAAHAYGASGVRCFSAGTETTAFEPRAVAALRECGFEIEIQGKGSNPAYRVRFAGSAPEVEAFSKRLDAAPNPREGFCAIMTCSSADADCPVVPGAALRISLPFEDPKRADGTEAEARTYLERSREIGTQMLYVFSRVVRTPEAR